MLRLDDDLSAAHERRPMDLRERRRRERLCVDRLEQALLLVAQLLFQSVKDVVKGLGWNGILQ